MQDSLEDHVPWYYHVLTLPWISASCASVTCNVDNEVDTNRQHRDVRNADSQRDEEGR
jgi:hypothetical protein